MNELSFLILFFTTIVIIFIYCTYLQAQKETEQIVSFFKKIKEGNVIIIYSGGYVNYFVYNHTSIDYENNYIILYQDYNSTVNLEYVSKLETTGALKISFNDIVLKEAQYKVLKYNK